MKGLCEKGVEVIRGLRNDGVLFYGRLENRRGKGGGGKLYEGKIEFENVEMRRCRE